MNMPKSIHDLIFRAIDESISDEEFDQLQEAIETDDEICQDYLLAIRLSEVLAEVSFNKHTGSSVGDQANLNRLEPLRTDRKLQATSNYAGFAGWLVALAATILLVGLSIHFLSRPLGDSSIAENGRSQSSIRSDGKPSESHRNESLYSNSLYVAKVQRVTSDVVWGAGSAAPDFLLRTRRDDRLHIESGEVELHYFSGAEITMHGPCAFVTTGASSGRLESGQVHGKVEGGDFLLHTPSARVLDLGTEFGVSITEGLDTEVQVFDGEVQVISDGMLDDTAQSHSVTEGMAVKVDSGGRISSSQRMSKDQLDRNIPETPIEIGDQVSLVDLLSASSSKRFGLSGVIAPDTGTSDQSPWLKTNGPGHRTGNAYRDTPWHHYVDGVFIPMKSGRSTQCDHLGTRIDLPASSGRTWGPVWSRRKIDGLSSIISREDFWGNLTLQVVTAKLSQCQTGMIGLHSNVGVTFDLDAVRSLIAPPSEFVCAVENLDNSKIKAVHHPEWLESKRFSADLRVFVDGQLRVSRLDFTRVDGQLGLSTKLNAEDRFLTIVSTDAGGFDGFDHVVLIDPVLKLSE